MLSMVINGYQFWQSYILLDAILNQQFFRNFNLQGIRALSLNLMGNRECVRNLDLGVCAPAAPVLTHSLGNILYLKVFYDMHSRNNKLQKLNLWIISNNNFKIVENSQCMMGNFVDRHFQQHFFLMIDEILVVRIPPMHEL